MADKLIPLLTPTKKETEAIRMMIWDKIGIKPHPKTAYLIAAITWILGEHKQYGKLTVRQVYYQLVSRAVIENSKKSYQNYVHHLTTGRKGGAIPWDAFEDRARMFYKEPLPTSMYDIRKRSGEDALKNWFRYILDPDISEYHKLPKWQNQPYFVELWVEKDALAGFLSPLCYDLGVGLVVSRGYTSYTFKQEAIQRFNQLSELEREPVLLYLGDLDPSGYDIFRCLRDEIQNAQVERIGLDLQDISQFGLKPNPKREKEEGKREDPRIPKFRRLFPELKKDEYYELDALPPGELVDRARRNILKYFDIDINEENEKRMQHWRANFTDIQEKYRKKLKKIGINLEN
jgi:hypothetical protein